MLDVNNSDLKDTDLASLTSLLVTVTGKGSNCVEWWFKKWKDFSS